MSLICKLFVGLTCASFLEEASFWDDSHADQFDAVCGVWSECSGFTLVVNLFNKDDAEDGGLSFFYSAETQSTN